MNQFKVEPLPAGDFGLSAFGVVPSLRLYVQVALLLSVLALLLGGAAKSVDAQQRP